MPPGDSRDRAEEVFAEYLVLRDAGAEADLEALCAEHPDEADHLRRLQQQHDQLQSRLRAVHPAVARTAAEWNGNSGESGRLVGSLLHDKYRIVKEIGRGGFGVVYEAVDERGAGNRVAIKLILPEFERTREQFIAFREEAHRVTLLHHPNIVDWKVFDQTPDGTPYFVMELLEGEELDKIVRREGRIEPARAARIMLDVLDALRAAHHV